MKQLKESSIIHLAASVCLGLCLVIGIVLGLGATPTRADGPDGGYVVVVFPDEQGTVRPISFTTSVSVVDALKETDWDVVTDSSNNVCSINGVGCPASNCFCSDNWWSAGKWITATNSWDTSSWPLPDVYNGDIAGFRWSKTSWGAPLLPGSVYTAAIPALDWLQARQNTDGSYGNMSSSAEVLLAIEANKLNGKTWGSPSLSSYIFGNTTTYANSSVSAASKLAVGLAAGGSCWQSTAKQPLDYYDTNTGKFSAGAGPQAWAVLGTHALSQSVPAAAVTYLKGLQQANGGWEWGFGWGTDTNSTALAIQALIATGELTSSTAIVNGLSYLETAQDVNSDGGFPYDPDSSYNTSSDANSTAYVIQALLAANESPTAARWTTNGSTPFNYLLSRQLTNGSFEYQTGTGADEYATRQAIPALLGNWFPLQTAELEECPNNFIPVIFKN